MTTLLMPKATAAWLIQNTTLTFQQIADFCKINLLQVQALADGDNESIYPDNPINNNQLTAEEIKRCEQDPSASLRLTEFTIPLSNAKTGAKYTPLSKRADKPDAVAWILRNHPEVGDAAIARLLGTTKSTIEAVRDKSHWNATNIKPRHPVVLGLCSEEELASVIERAQKRAGKNAAKSDSDDASPDTDDKLTAQG